MFRKDLYTASQPFFAPEVFDQMASCLTRSSDGSWEDVKIKRSRDLVSMARAIQANSSRDLVKPQMVLALMTEVCARQWADAWSKENPLGSEAETEGANHDAFTERMIECLEILAPELGKWYPQLAFSLRDVRMAINEIRCEDCKK